MYVHRNGRSHMGIFLEESGDLLGGLIAGYNWATKDYFSMIVGLLLILASILLRWKK